MRVVIATDSYKESLSAVAVAETIARGWRQVFPAAECQQKPMSDGGEGFVAAMVTASGGQCVPAQVQDTLGRNITAHWGLSGDQQIGFIEMAAASGLERLTLAERNPMQTSSYGTGQLIQAALATGLKRLVIGIGGSATHDGGMGMMQALVITGEGCLDAQSLRGKVPYGIAQLAKQHQKPVIAIAGSVKVEPTQLQQAGIDAAFGAVQQVMPLTQALEQAEQQLYQTSVQVAQAIKLGAQVTDSAR